MRQQVGWRWVSRRWIVQALGVVGAAAVVGCSAPAPASAPARSAAPSTAAPAPQAAAPPQPASVAEPRAPAVPYRFVFPGINFAALPFHTAETQGFYRDQGVEGEMLPMPSTTGVAALLAGDVQGLGSVGTAVKAAVAGSPIKVVFATAHTQLFDLVSRPDIQSGEQLRGKIVSSADAGGAQDLATLAALAHLGLTERDVTLLRSRAENQVRMEQLRLGQIDATAVIPPLNLQARREGMNILVSTRDIYPLPLQGLAVRVGSLEVPAERDVHLRFLKATYRAMEWIRANRSEAAVLMTDWLQYDRGLAEETYDASLPGLSPDGMASEAAMRNAILAALDGDTSRTVSIAEVADWTLGQQAVREVRAGQ